VGQDSDRWWICCECGNEVSDSIKCENFFDPFNRLSFVALTTVSHCADSRVLQRQLLRMRSNEHLFGGLWFMTTYSLVGD
jgi:hypothetical protein